MAKESRAELAEKREKQSDAERRGGVNLASQMC